LANERNIEIDNRILLGEDISLRVDVDRLQRVLANLLNNAILYNREHGQVILSHEMTGDSLKISIQDGGEGLTDDEIDKIFHPFERLHSHAQIEGAGLGLLIARNLMLSLKGCLEVDSRPNEGSTFWINFPYYIED